MKFSILLALALTFTTLASAQTNFHVQNAQEAEQLTKEFAKLTPNSSCTDGQQACVNNQFAQCVGGKFQLTQCSAGTQCTVLPLVNKAGTSITCDTAADQKARIATALGGQNSSPAGSSNSSSGNPSPAGTGSDAGKGKGKKGKSKNKKDKKGKDKKGKDKKGKTINNNAQGNPNDVNQGQNNNGTAAAPPQKRKATPTNSTTNGDFHKQNAAEAESLQKQFDSLTPNSPCTSGQQACVQKQFAQCVNNKFVQTPCSAGLECAALPLVLKKGTSIACTTEADRQARIKAAQAAKK